MHARNTVTIQPISPQEHRRTALRTPLPRLAVRAWRLAPKTRLFPAASGWLAGVLLTGVVHAAPVEPASSEPAPPPADAVGASGDSSESAGDVGPASNEVEPVANAAVEFYYRGDFSAALDRFERAYELDPNPLYLFSRAQCLRRLERLGPACDSYREHLQKSAEPDPRAEFWATRLASYCTVHLDPPAYPAGATARQLESPTTPVTSTGLSQGGAPPADRTPVPYWTNTRLGWVALAGATGAGLVASAFYAQQLSYRDEYERATTGDEQHAARREFDRAKQLTLIFGGTAAALGVTGAILLLLPSAVSEHGTVAVEFGSQFSAGASYRRSF